MENLWSRVIDSLKERVGQQNFDIWIKPISFVSMEEEKLELEVPNRFFKEWINEHYASHIKEAVSLLTQKRCNLQLRIRSGKPSEGDTDSSPLPTKRAPALYSLQTIFNPKYTFANFVVGASNQFANAACMAVANLPAKNYTPPFLYGGGGLGN